MMEIARHVSLLVAATTVGLAAGLFAAFAYAVMPGLRRVDDPTFVATMRAINVAIQNVWLVLVLGGGLVASAAAVVLHLVARGGAATGWVTAGFASYLVTLLVTGRANVPLNDGLADVGDRRAFEVPWTRWNLVRTGTSLIASTCLVLAGVLGP